MSSIIYNLNGNDNTLILDTRASFLQSFKALNWTDLRLSIMWSLTSQSAPDQQTGLAETIGAGADADIAYMGFKQSDANLPRQTNFFGFSTHEEAVPAAASQLIDTVNGYYQPANTNSLQFPLLVSNGVTRANNPVSTVNAPNVQDGSGILTGYASLLILQMTRNDPTLNLVNGLFVNVSTNQANSPIGNQSTNIPFLTDTSVTNIRNLTRAAIMSTNLLGPFTFGSVPDAIYFYWPFLNSRLRIHDYVLEKFA